MNLQTGFLIFIIYSFFGWICETIYTLIKKKRLLNRGFLIGPLIPIYGLGALIITVFFTKYSGDAFVLFVSAVAICSILEYFTSYLLEKLFKVRWWDYSQKKYNINGRICLETMIPFGLLSLLLIYVFNPLVLKIFSLIPNNIMFIIIVILAVLFILDVMVSIILVIDLKKINFTKNEDNTEEIKEEIKEEIEEKKEEIENVIKEMAVKAKREFPILKRRILDSFPNLKK